MALVCPCRKLAGLLQIEQKTFVTWLVAGVRRTGRHMVLADQGRESSGLAGEGTVALA